MDDLRIDDQLARWSEIGTGYARSLPPSPKIEPNLGARQLPAVVCAVGGGGRMG
jgi:hypothetical protein